LRCGDIFIINFRDNVLRSVHHNLPLIAEGGSVHTTFWSDKQTSTSLSSTNLSRSQFHHLWCHDRWWCNTLRLRHNICSDSLRGQVRPRLPITSCVVDCGKE